MARPGPSSPASSSSPVRTVLALVLVGGLLIATADTAYFLFTGRRLLTFLATAPTAQLQAEREPIPGQPTNAVAAISTPTAVSIAIPAATPAITPEPAQSEATATAAPTSTASSPVQPASVETSLPEEAPVPTPTEQWAIVAVDVVNLRGGPGLDFPIVGQVSLGQPFQAIARSAQSDWLEICCPVDPDQTAWISTQLIILLGSTEELPVNTTSSTPESSVPAPVVEARRPSGNTAAGLARPSAVFPTSGEFGSPGEKNPLTGRFLATGQRLRRPLIVCINNDFAARPQFGTSRADVMYEYLMEGFGITRFSGIYYGERSEQIGPVRSARLINLSLGALYDAGLVCSGASDPVRFSLKNDVPFPYLDIDLDDPSNSRYTVSIGNDYRTRLRTSSAGMRRWLADWGVERAPVLRGFTFGNLPTGGAPATAINIPYPAATGSQVAYKYDARSGRYLRFLGGVPHLDGNNSTQLALETVIVQFVPHEVTDIVEDSLGSKSIRLNLFGSGKAILFRNGVGFEGTWRSNSQGDMPRFFDHDNREIPLKVGNTWISVTPLTYAIAYQ